jgi:hypothetical protein
LNSQPTRRSDDAASNFAAVGDQDALEHAGDRPLPGMARPSGEISIT